MRRFAGCSRALCGLWLQALAGIFAATTNLAVENPNHYVGVNRRLQIPYVPRRRLGPESRPWLPIDLASKPSYISCALSRGHSAQSVGSTLRQLAGRDEQSFRHDGVIFAPGLDFVLGIPGSWALIDVPAPAFVATHCFYSLYMYCGQLSLENAQRVVFLLLSNDLPVMIDRGPAQGASNCPAFG